MTVDFAKTFPENYRKLILSQNSRDKNKKYNKQLKNNSYILVYPFKRDDNKLEYLVGFSNNPKVVPVGDDFMSEAYQHVKNNYEVLTTTDTETTIKETVVIPTSSFEPIEVEKISWQAIIDAPKIEDGSFDLLVNSFLEYFSLDSVEYIDGKPIFDFNHYFCQDNNQPKDLELRTVWIDVDDEEKYGNIETLIFWKNKFIGWVSRSGRWLDSTDTSTVDVMAWQDLMETIYKNTGFVRENLLKGVTVYDMNQEHVDDLLHVPGISQKNYS